MSVKIDCELSAKPEMLEALIEEHSNVSEEIRHFESQYSVIFGLAITVVGSAYYFGAKDNLSVFFFIIPLGVIWVATYSIHWLASILQSGAYKRYLEIKINDLLGGNYIVWESLRREKWHRNYFNVVLGLVNFGFSFTIVAFAFRRIYMSYWHAKLWSVIVIGLVTVASLFMLGIGVAKAFKISSNTDKYLSTINGFSADDTNRKKNIRKSRMDKKSSRTKTKAVKVSAA
jgi:hypothetical protein